MHLSLVNLIKKSMVAGLLYAVSALTYQFILFFSYQVNNLLENGYSYNLSEVS